MALILAATSKYPESGKTRLITDDERPDCSAISSALRWRAGASVPELGIRLQFAFAARMSEIISMEWEWIDFVNRRVVWPDSKTGEISKPMSEDVVALLSNAPRLEGSPYVVPSIFKPGRPMSQTTYSRGWTRVLERARVPHVGTHGFYDHH